MSASQASNLMFSKSYFTAEPFRLLSPLTAGLTRCRGLVRHVRSRGSPTAQFSLITADEATDLTDDIRELFQDLARSLARALRAYSGKCHPSLDVHETDS